MKGILGWTSGWSQGLVFEAAYKQYFILNIVLEFSSYHMFFIFIFKGYFPFTVIMKLLTLFPRLYNASLSLSILHLPHRLCCPSSLLLPTDNHQLAVHICESAAFLLFPLACGSLLWPHYLLLCTQVTMSTKVSPSGRHYEASLLCTEASFWSSPWPLLCWTSHNTGRSPRHTFPTVGLTFY